MGMDRNPKKQSKPLPAVVLGVCLLGGAAWFWDGVAKDRLIPKR